MARVDPHPDRSLREKGLGGDIVRSVYTHSGELADSTKYGAVEAIAEGRE